MSTYIYIYTFKGYVLLRGWRVFVWQAPVECLRKLSDVPEVVWFAGLYGVQVFFGLEVWSVGF